MFDVLTASGPPLQIQTRWLTTSVVTHGLIIALAVLATRAALDAPKIVPPESMLVFVPKPPPPPPPEAKPVHPAIVTLAAPPPKGFQTVVAPSDLPQEIPPVNLNEKPLDPRDFTGQGTEGGVADGVVGGTGPVTSEDVIYEATADLPGFQPAEVLSEPPPKYPPELAAVGLAGRVAMEFVIDTTGKVEVATVKVLESSHKAFEAAAVSATAGFRFHPARISGHPVRQLTRQSVRFVATQ